MEKLKQSPPRKDGEAITETFRNVLTPQDVATLWLSAICFVSGRGFVRSDDLVMARQNLWGTIGNGINFSRENSGHPDLFRVRFRRDRREAVLFINKVLNKAAIVTKDSSGIAA